VPACVRSRQDKSKRRWAEAGRCLAAARVTEDPKRTAGHGVHLLLLPTLCAGAAWLLAEVGQLVPWWSSAPADLLAACGMGAYLWWAHPRLREELRRYDEREFAMPSRGPA